MLEAIKAAVAMLGKNLEEAHLKCLSIDRKGHVDERGMQTCRILFSLLNIKLAS